MVTVYDANRDGLTHGDQATSSEDMDEKIRLALNQMAASHNVRILLAVESGSRAWGFASTDSDYDVRFIYAHPADWYVSVETKRDVIEAMFEGDIDAAG